jgi:hypothetical protein
LVLQQFPEQFQGRSLVAPLLDQHVQHLAFIIDSAPKQHAPAADLHNGIVKANEYSLFLARNRLNRQNDS